MKKQKPIKTLSSRIKALRIDKGLTQLDLAAKMDVDVKTVKRLEAGLESYNPTLSTIEAVSKALGVGIKDLF